MSGKTTFLESEVYLKYVLHDEGQQNRPTGRLPILL